MSEYQDFTSLPRNEEALFTVYERRTVEDSKKALTLGIIVSGLVGLFTVIVVLSFDPPKNQHAEDMMEAELAAEKDEARTEPRSPTRAAEPAPAEAAAEEAAAGAEGAEAGAEGAEGAEAGAEGAEAGAEGAEAAPVEAPPPPKGATKAPPTALTGQ